ncbi:MAG: DUF4347 domain-containing protein, partial [Planctomycetaceae bacterium]|nr:DUF4347 domain-containing protein [Planctomycetaceae bacterium]
ALQLMQLEPRIMLSATPAGAAAEGMDADALDQAAFPEVGDLLPSTDDGDAESFDASTSDAFTPVPLVDVEELPLDLADVRHELVVIDPSAADYQQLIDDLLAQDDPSREMEIVLLDGSRDGIEQISEILNGRSDLDALHIVSHGRDGAVKLGDTWFDSARLSQDAGQIAAWGAAFTEEGDLLLYGCDLAGTAEGRLLVDSLAELGGFDVAASSDDTGQESLGGDWDLEYQSGLIESEVAFSSDLQQNWDGLLAPGTPGTAIWAESGSTVPETNYWDGVSFGTEGSSVSTGQWQIIDGAEAPTRDEKIVVGVNSGGTISGMSWDGSSWAALPFSLDTVTSGTSHGFDVAYESQSGDGLLIWNNGTAGNSPLSYREWDGTTWSSEKTITTPFSGEATEMRLAASPVADEMVLIVSNDAGDDYALVWDGSNWGDSIALDTNVSGQRTEIGVAYESLSGHAMVVFDNSGGSPSSLGYRT